jgi:hypothetical protein
MELRGIRVLLSFCEMMEAEFEPTQNLLALLVLVKVFLWPARETV